MLQVGDWTAEQAVTLFCQAAAQLGLTEAEDVDYSVNRLLDLLQLDEPQAAASLVPILDLADMLVEYAVEKKLCEDSPEARERYNARLFGLVTPGPRAVREEFYKRLREKNSLAATNWFYQLCCDSNYIRTRRISENIQFSEKTPAGLLEIRISLLKPQKDPRDMALERMSPSLSYPKCPLCRENPGYAGRPGYPARQNHRIIPVTLQGKPWYLQYSPYQDYEEHCILLNREHVPMRTTPESFEEMIDFIDLFPHYFIGSNADLPIVGGNILVHDHLQGGRHVFPVESAESWFSLDTGMKGLSVQALKWPMTCLKIEGESREILIEAMSRLLAAWRSYFDEPYGVLARSNVRHNAITPMIRKTEKGYTAYVLLRNNLTTAEHPMGLFHPHEEYHHIKQSNIGMLEAMGLFILNGRLKKELAQVADFLKGLSALPPTNPHRMWIKELSEALPENREDVDITEFIRHQLAQKCCLMLADTGIYKQNEEGEAGLRRFLESVF